MSDICRVKLEGDRWYRGERKERTGLRLDRFARGCGKMTAALELTLGSSLDLHDSLRFIMRLADLFDETSNGKVVK